MGSDLSARFLLAQDALRINLGKYEVRGTASFLAFAMENQLFDAVREAVDMPLKDQLRGGLLEQVTDENFLRVKNGK